MPDEFRAIAEPLMPVTVRGKKIGSFGIRGDSLRAATGGHDVTQIKAVLEAIVVNKASPERLNFRR